MFVVLAYLAGLTYGWREARRMDLDTAIVADISLWLFVGGILGARVLFVIVAYKHFLAAPLDVLKIWQGGLVWYGGLAGGVAAGLIYLRRHALPIVFWSDLLAPMAIIALAVGRIGCFLNGCCYGAPATWLPSCFTYPASHPALGLAQIPVHPVPLYESAACFTIFGFLVWRLRHRRFPGQVFWNMALFYAIIRFGLEFLRFDQRGVVPLLKLSTSQTISIAVAVLSVFFLVRLKRKAQGKEGGSNKNVAPINGPTRMSGPP